MHVAIICDDYIPMSYTLNMDYSACKTLVYWQRKSYISSTCLERVLLLTIPMHNTHIYFRAKMAELPPTAPNNYDNYTYRAYIMTKKSERGTKLKSLRVVLCVGFVPDSCSPTELVRHSFPRWKWAENNAWLARRTDVSNCTSCMYDP